MKREHPIDDFAGVPKRPRQQGFGNGHVNSQPRPYNSSNSHPQPRHYQNSSSSSSRTQHNSQRDPTKSLDTLLKALVARPDATKQSLGQEAFDSAVTLSNALSSRINTATASLDLFQPSTVEPQEVPRYVSVSISEEKFPLPSLPMVPKGPYSKAPFMHKSTNQHDRTSAVGDLTYERLEFLGDAYLEVIATRLIYSRYPHLAAGRQAQIRERLVKNETLTHFSIAYRFQEKLEAQTQDRELGKASGKILADVFEAYIAAIILSDPETGFKRAETWLTELWAPILLREYGPGGANSDSVHQNYNANAKQELQQKIVAKDTRLEYLEYKPMLQDKHIQRYFISLFLTGWGHEKLLMGSGEGQNKVEAGNRAAMDAMVKSKDVIDECARQLAAVREERKKVHLEAVKEKHAMEKQAKKEQRQ